MISSFIFGFQALGIKLYFNPKSSHGLLVFILPILVLLNSNIIHR